MRKNDCYLVDDDDGDNDGYKEDSFRSIFALYSK